ncbi:unnamed protein product [Paramecium sonneborni]|uniref:Protein kinase domain-containing protein n=1 Tax=Paramecium sonneborni TaxID=65129 RepID=A0A8S1QJL5_9CILI|nr:unnamed protein product [Paramecium sonneborni]
MGNTELKPQIVHSNQWVMIKQLNHPLYGPIKVFKNSQEKQQCLRTFTLQEEEANKINEEIKKVNEEQYNFVKINKIEHEVESQLCSTFHKIHLTIDYTEKNLKNIYQIDVQKFSLEMLRTLAFLDFRKRDTCQFSLSKLLLFGDQVRIVDQQLLCQQSDYQRILSGDIKCEDWYFAPEVLKCLRMNDYKQFNNEKATIFNFGLIMISLYTEVTPYEAEIYNYEKYCLTEKFDKYLKLFTQFNLNKNLEKQILDCVSMIPDRRPTYSQLLDEFSNPSIFEQEVEDKSPSPQKAESSYLVPTDQLVSFNPTLMDERVLSDTTNKKLNDNKILMKKIDQEKHQNTPICQSPKFRQESLQTQTTVGNLRSTKLYNLEGLQKQQRNIQNKSKSQQKKLNNKKF